jgi:rsbT co-antagonist protein RsbR
MANDEQEATEDGPSDEEIRRRLAWCAITDDDLVRVRQLATWADDLAGPIIDSFYDHILAFEAAQKFFHDPQAITRIKTAQRHYFQGLTAGRCDAAYFAERYRVGEIHERIGLGPDMYIGAFDFYLGELGKLLLDRLASDPKSAFELYLSLQKLAHLDMALALETYITARERTIEAQQKNLSELPTPVLKLRDGLLLIPVVGALDSHRARQLTIQLLEAIKQVRAQVVVLDITGVAAVDSGVANHLSQTMSAARLMGATSIVTGISPSVAQALVKIGVGGALLNTAADLEGGIVQAEQLLGADR